MPESWRSTGWFVEPQDPRAVIATVGAIGVHSKQQRFAWRGMPDEVHDISSSLHRHAGGGERDVRAAEETVLEEARSWGLGVHPTGYVDDLQLLADLQHYGIATRLIDVTSNPLTALWFACQPSANGSSNGVLLALNITDWDPVTSAGAYEPTWDDSGREYSARLKSALGSTRPFVVRAHSPNDRMRAQEGFFIASQTPNPSPLRPIFRSISLEWAPGDPDLLQHRLLSERGPAPQMILPFVAVIIRDELKERILRSLEGSFNRTPSVLFPDYAGFAKFGESVRNRLGIGGT